MMVFWQRFRVDCLRAVVIAVAVCAAFALRGADASGKKSAAKKEHPASTAGDDIFTNLVVLKLRIQISPSELDVLRGNRSSGFRGFRNNAATRPNAVCTVFEGTTVYTNVAIHLKGSRGSFRSVDDDPALTLSFDKAAPGQTFHGLKKISLNNSVQDPTYLCERLSREIFLASGQPVPRAGFATLQFNHTDLGMRVLLEGYDKVFLKRYFHDVSGNLYDGGFVQDINTSVAILTGDHRDDRSDLRQLVSAMNRPPEQLLPALDKILDLNRFISMLAMETILVHWDGYSMNVNNYRIYHDMDQNRLMFMPHGMDQMFGVRRSSPDLSITPETKGELASGIRGTPEGSLRYLEAVRELSTKYFIVEKLTNRVAELSTCVSNAIAEHSPNEARNYMEQVRWLRERIIERGASLKQQLGLFDRVVKFDTNGSVSLSDWKSKIERGTPMFSNLVVNEELESLQFSGNGAGSYRTRVTLLPGKYRFEGDVKLENLVGDEKDAHAGVCLRINDWTSNNARRLTGTTDGWTHYVHKFQIVDSLSDWELLCEVRAKSGKVIFNARSMKLTKE